MKDWLPTQPNKDKTDIVDFDINIGPRTHEVVYAIDPRVIIYFDAYGLASRKSSCAIHFD